MYKYDSTAQVKDDNKTQPMRFACCTQKATNTHSEYVTLIARPLQQWLLKRALMLHYTYNTSLQQSTFS